MLFLKPLSAVFFIAYLACGLSDLLDGYIARKTGSASKFGASLDSIADLIFVACLLVVMVPVLDIPIWALYWMAGIAISRFASFLIGFYKYHTAAFLHTYANKLTGLLLFCFPVFFLFWGIRRTAGLICIAASISAVEELLINMTSKTLSRDIRSIFKP